MELFAILCTYPSGRQRLISTFLEEKREDIPDEYIECIQGCNPNNYYEVVGVQLNYLKERNDISTETAS